MIDLNEFAKEVHANAVAHGWYDGGERTEAEIFANIHSEWSEAFDAYAHGLPWYYHKCTDTATPGVICESAEDCYVRKIGKSPDMCFIKDAKPEGIAVELIDGAIRMLDFAGYLMEKGKTVRLEPNDMVVKFIDAATEKEDFCAMICGLHTWTSSSLEEGRNDDELWDLDAIIYLAFKIVRGMGLDPEKIMLEKHEYNKTRPYRHGGKVV